MDIKELQRGLRGIVRAGIVSSVHPERNAVRVVFEDKDNNVTKELPMMNRGAAKNKDFWLPDEGDPVVCLFAANDKNISTGWVIGAYFDEKHPPQVQSADKRRLDFSDGTFIEYDRAAHSLTINCVGAINITGATVHIN